MANTSIRHRRLVWIAVALSAICSSPNLVRAQRGASPRDSVRAVAEAIIAADNASDLEGVMRVYAADAVLLPPNETAVIGKDAIRPRYAALFTSMVPAIVCEVDEVQVASDWAFVRGRNTGVMRPRSGSGPARRLNDVFLMVLHREADGRWRIARRMWHGAG